jgi:hypothetical protein
MHLVYLLRSSKQRYMQFAPVLTTVGARTCTTWRFVYICSDSKAALLAPFSYRILSKLLHQCWLTLQYLSNNNRVTLFWVPGHCDIKGKEADRLLQMGWDSHFCGPESCVPQSASIVRDMNRKWVIDVQSKHWIALNSCGLNTQSCKQPNTSWVGVYSGLSNRNPVVCFPKRKIRDKPLTQLYFRLISFFTSHLGEHIRPKQRPACRILREKTYYF